MEKKNWKKRLLWVAAVCREKKRCYDDDLTMMKVEKRTTANPIFKFVVKWPAIMRIHYTFPFPWYGGTEACATTLISSHISEWMLYAQASRICANRAFTRERATTSTASALLWIVVYAARQNTTGKFIHKEEKQPKQIIASRTRSKSSSWFSVGFQTLNRIDVTPQNILCSCTRLTVRLARSGLTETKFLICIFFSPLFIVCVLAPCVFFHFICRSRFGPDTLNWISCVSRCTTEQWEMIDCVHTSVCVLWLWRTIPVREC